MKTIGIISIFFLIFGCAKNPTEIKGNYCIFSTKTYDSTENIENIKFDTLPIYNQKLDPYFYKENLGVLKFLPPNLKFDPDLHEDEVLHYGYDNDHDLSFIIEKQFPENEYIFHFDEYENLFLIMKSNTKLNKGKSTRIIYSIELINTIRNK